MPVTKTEKVDPDAAKVNPNTQEVTREVAPTTASKQDLPEVKEEENSQPQSYVHLANGNVLRCDDEDLPAGGGTGAPHGFWQQGGKAYQIIGVYPVEVTTEGN